MCKKVDFIALLAAKFDTLIFNEELTVQPYQFASTGAGFLLCNSEADTLESVPVSLFCHRSKLKKEL